MSREYRSRESPFRRRVGVNAARRHGHDRAATLLWTNQAIVMSGRFRTRPQPVHRRSTKMAARIHMGPTSGGCFIPGLVAQSTRREETRRGRDGKPEGQASGTLQDPRTEGRLSETGPGADQRRPGATQAPRGSMTSRPQVPSGAWVRGRCGRATGSIGLLLHWGHANPPLIPAKAGTRVFFVAALRPAQRARFIPNIEAWLPAFAGMSGYEWPAPPASNTARCAAKARWNAGRASARAT